VLASTRGCGSCAGDVAALLGRKEQRVLRTRRLAFDRVQCDRLQWHRPPTRLRLRALQPTLPERAADIDNLRPEINVAPFPTRAIRLGEGRSRPRRSPSAVSGARDSQQPHQARPMTRRGAAPCAAATGYRRRASPVDVDRPPEHRTREHLPQRLRGSSATVSDLEIRCSRRSRSSSRSRACAASCSEMGPPRCTRFEARPPTRYRKAHSDCPSRPARFSRITWPCCDTTITPFASDFPKAHADGMVISGGPHP
jgi:hypothetical protein